jgi:hypothetical protein
MKLINKSIGEDRLGHYGTYMNKDLRQNWLMVVVGERLKSQRKNNNKITDRIKIVNASS